MRPGGRETFGSRFGLVATMIGVAVGLGNVWRFPYMVGEFGGAPFVAFYVLAVVLIGVPALMAEWTLGRHTRRGPVGAFESAGLPLGRALGWTFFVGVAAATGYYSNALGWVLYHALAGLLSGVGVEIDAAAILPPDDGFSLRSLLLQCVCTGAVLLTCAAVLRRGLRGGIEKASRFIVPALLAGLVILIARSLTLPGAAEGLRWYLGTFDSGALTPPVMLGALGQAIFSLSLGGTFMVVYGSYLNRDDPLRGNAVFTAGGDLCAGLLAGLAIFPAVFAFGLEPASGPGLLFVTLPDVFGQIPAGAVFGTLFFLALFGGAYLSDVAALEVLVAGVTDNARIGRSRAVTLTTAVVFVFALPPMINMNVFTPWDLTFGSGFQTLGALLSVVAVGWALDRSKVLRQLAAGEDRPRKRRLPTLWLYYWLRFVIPAAILAVGGWWLLRDVRGAGAPPADRVTLAIEDVSVIPMDGERVLAGVTVLIGDGRVLAVQPSAEADVPGGTVRVDGRGRFLIPGLNDMHVHFGEEWALGRFLATGVTGVRILSGGPHTLDFRDRVRRGELAGPDIHTAGVIIEGLPPPGFAAVIDTAGRLIVRDSLDGVRAVRAQHSAGYDFIKVYNNVPAAAYRGIVAEARGLGVPVAGHVPFEVGLEGVLAAGQPSIEHLRGYIWHLVPEDAQAQPGPDLRSRTLAWAHGDPSRIEALAERTREAGSWNVPTLSVRMIHKPDRLLDAYLATEEASHMSDAMRRFYTERMSIPWMSNFTPDDFEAALDGFAVADSLIRALVALGAPVMAGTDTPPLGFALHRELEELVAAGLSPYEALRSATVNPARFLEREEGDGMVVAGSPADLVLLGGNPLEVIGNTRRIVGVARRGEWLDRATLDAMLREAARH